MAVKFETLPSNVKDAISINSKYFYTGKVCKFGHLSNRLTSTRACVECNNERYLNNRKKILEKSKNRYEKLKKQDSDFDKKRYVKSRETHEAYREKNKEIRNAQHKEWYLKNHNHVLDYAKAYNANVPISKKREQARKSYVKNKDRFIANVATRRASKLKRTPQWLSREDKQLIGFMYKIAARVSKETGIKHHIDHTIPLQGEFVSGLHVPNNLQLLTAFDNLSKGNTFFIGGT